MRKHLLWKAGIVVFALACTFGGTAYCKGAQKKTVENIDGEYAVGGHFGKELPTVGKTKDISKKGNELTIPISYNSLTEGDYISPIRNQSRYGSCWTFAGMAISESWLNKNGLGTNVDLSEWHLAHYAFESYGDAMGLTNEDCMKISDSEELYDAGGDNILSASTFAKWIGPISENKMKYSELLQYTDVMTMLTSNVIKNELQDSQDAYHLSSAEYVPGEEMNRIKAKVMEYGSGDTGICYLDGYESDDEGSYFYDGDELANHEVCIVGWDDNYSKDNFTGLCKPQNNGAWLIRNSWGEYNPDAEFPGYFWVSYEDPSVTREKVSFFKYETADKYDCNYQYDGAYYTSSIEAADYSKEANVFTAQNKEAIGGVGFWTLAEDTDYEIQVYVNPTDDDPDSGTPAFDEPVAGTTETQGYFTVNLPQTVQVNKGDRFAIVVTLSQDGKNISLPIESSSVHKIGNFYAGAGAKESYVYSDGDGSWYDWGADTDCNLRIKAFTKVSTDAVKATDIQVASNEVTVLKGDTKQIETTLLPENVSDTRIQWLSSNMNVAKVSGGEILGISAGNATITGSINGHNVAVNVTVIENKITNITTDEDSFVLNVNGAHKLKYTTIVENPENNVTDSVLFAIDEEDEEYIASDEDGNIYGLAETPEGETVTVRAYVKDNESIDCSFHVQVKSVSPENMTLELLQSTHPYVTNHESVWEYKRLGVDGFYLNFSKDCQFELNYDYFYIYDKNDNKIGVYTGNQLASQRVYVPGDYIRMVLVADIYQVDYGFKVDSIEEVKSTPTTPTLTPSITPIPGIIPSIDNPSVALKAESSSKYIAVGKSAKITANQNVTYQVSNTKYATVSSDGVVKALKAGAGKKVTVTVTAANGSSKSFTFTLYKKAVKKISQKKVLKGKKGKTISIASAVKVSPSKNVCKKLSYSVSGKGVSITSSGKLTVSKSCKLKKIKVTIKALDGSGKKGTIIVKIK